ncbi:unnamed protein product [Lepeophtheirus salmonis]|uniref:(salmon louse) hypothetical protein n=1 Tax=Lepeophtheirus salmonis TaxID=72036 RepID=A0A7R8CN73_LEPSM|nr:unnamed protein product [Lepeophtheirus salmonis]CAF2870310.1 unnamed protein product [Lepeophtheirus salmonis]
MATSSSNLPLQDSGSINSESGIRYSLKIMEEPICNFEFQTGIDLASIVNSEIFDKVPPTNSSSPVRPSSPRPTKVRSPKRSSSFLTFKRRSLPPSYLQEALHSLFQKSSPDFNNCISSNKKSLRPHKYPQHDLPLSFLNKRLISRFPLNLYEKFRHKSHATMSSFNESSSGPTEHTTSSSSSSSSTSISPTELKAPGGYVEAVERADGALNTELQKESSSDGSVNLRVVKKNTILSKGCIFKYKGTLKRHLLVKHTSGDGVIDFNKGVKSQRCLKQSLFRKRN